MMRRFPHQHHLDDQQVFVLCCVYLTGLSSLFIAYCLSSLWVWTSLQAVITSAALHRCIACSLGDMHIIALVHCRLIPVGEDDWLREGEDGVRKLQQALQLEGEVRIKIHKVSSPLLATQYLACGHITPS